MSWSYSGNPQSSLRDELRFLIGDTDESEPIMQDEELDFLITKYGSNRNLLLYHTFETVATYFARDIKRSLGPISEDPTERLKFYKEQAKMYKNKVAASMLSVPAYGHPKVFRKGMHNNPPWPKKGDKNV